MGQRSLLFIVCLFITISIFAQDQNWDFKDPVKTLEHLREKKASGESGLRAADPEKELIFLWGLNKWDTVQLNNYSYLSSTHTQVIQQTYSGGAFMDAGKIDFYGDYSSFEFDSLLSYVWNNNQWNTQYKIYFTYNANGDPLQLEFYQNQGGSLTLIATEHYYYDLNGYPEAFIGYSFGVPSDSSYYLVDVSGNIVEEHVFGYNVGTWENREKIFYNNYSGDNPGEIIYQKWNASSMAFDNETRETYTYSSGGAITMLVQEYWNGTSWENSYRYSATLTANDTYQYELEEYYTGTAWDSSYQVFYTLNAMGDYDSIVAQSKTASWGNEIKYKYFYTPVLIKEVEKNNNKLFPNPSDGLIHLTLTSHNNDIKIFNILGNMVYSEKVIGINKKQLQLDLAKGIYFMEITNPRGREVIKFNITK